jgi:hypothetical protein
MGLHKWNGGGHQKVVVEKQSGYEGSVVRMKMQHSNMYLRATTDGERVVQSWADDWEWNQMWRLLPDTVKADSGTTALTQNANLYGTSVHYADNQLFVELGNAFVDGAVVRVLDLHGREIMRRWAPHSVLLNVQDLAPGIYHVVVRDKSRTDIRRFKK